MPIVNFGILAQAGGDNGAGAFIVLAICVGLCVLMNKKPPTKVETVLGQKTTEYK
ncbi:MAG: hypothetical protein AAGA30_08635 [Planctomycetota bacterium]